MSLKDFPALLIFGLLSTLTMAQQRGYGVISSALSSNSNKGTQIIGLPLAPHQNSFRLMQLYGMEQMEVLKLKTSSNPSYQIYPVPFENEFFIKSSIPITTFKIELRSLNNQLLQVVSFLEEDQIRCWVPNRHQGILIASLWINQQLVIKKILQKP